MTRGPWTAHKPAHGIPYVTGHEGQIVAERVYNGNEDALAALPDLIRAGWALSTWAAAIHWGEGETNAPGWLDGLRERIEAWEAVARLPGIRPGEERS